MFKQFFRPKENQFKLAPDPAYLFLSTGHEEALAHLRYRRNPKSANNKKSRVFTDSAFCE
jgi:hypothetical protein